MTCAGVTPGAEEGGGGEEEPELGRAGHPVHVHAGGGRGRGELQGGGGGAPDDQGGGQHHGAVHGPQGGLARVLQSAAGSAQPHQRRGHARAAGAHQVPALGQAGVGQLGEVSSAGVHHLLHTQGQGAGAVSGQEAAAPAARPPPWQTASRPR